MANEAQSEVERLIQQIIAEAALGSRATVEHLRDVARGLPGQDQTALLKLIRVRIAPAFDGTDPCSM